MKHKTLALPLSRVNYSDSSQVVELYSRDFGLIRGIAKGAHREGRSAFQGPFDLGTLIELVFIERPELSILTEKVDVEGFRGLRRSYRAHLGGSAVLDYLRVVGREGQPLPDLFVLATQCLQALARGGEPRAALVLFGVQALRILGWSPEITRCVRCGRDPFVEEPARFSPESGGVICPGCRQPRDRSIPSGALRVLGSLSRTWPPPWGRLAIPHSLMSGIRSLLIESTVFRLERQPKMLQYLGVEL